MINDSSDKKENTVKDDDDGTAFHKPSIPHQCIWCDRFKTDGYFVCPNCGYEFFKKNRS